MFHSNIEGIDNEELARVCMAAASQKKVSQESNTGYTDVPVDGANKEIVRLRKTVKKIIKMAKKIIIKNIMKNTMKIK